MRRFIALAVASLWLATACSVPRDDQARIVHNPEPDESVPITRPDGPRAQAKLYFVRSSDNKLEAVTTNVRMQGPGVPPGPNELLEALIIDGPQESRLESKIPNNVRFETRQGGDKELIVILPDFHPKGVNRDVLILAFQQMVYTLTELPDVNSVQFSVENALYRVPLKIGGDKPVGQGVRRQDYDFDSIYTTTTTVPPTTTAPTTIPTATPTSGPPASASVAPGASVTSR